MELRRRAGLGDFNLFSCADMHRMAQRGSFGNPNTPSERPPSDKVPRLLLSSVTFSSYSTTAFF